MHQPQGGRPLVVHEAVAVVELDGLRCARVFAPRKGLTEPLEQPACETSFYILLDYCATRTGPPHREASSFACAVSKQVRRSRRIPRVLVPLDCSQVHGQLPLSACQIQSATRSTAFISRKERAARRAALPVCSVKSSFDQNRMRAPPWTRSRSCVPLKQPATLAQPETSDSNRRQPRYSSMAAASICCTTPMP